MNLDGVVGDARKKIEPSWAANREPMYRPVARLTPFLALLVNAGRVRMAELPSSDPT